MTNKLQSNQQFINPGNTSPAVEQTIRDNPPTHTMGYHLDDAKSTTDIRKRPRRKSPAAMPSINAFASNTVQGPASIAELSRALNVGPVGNGPQLMFEWVYNNIEWEPGWGVQKGAMCLMDGMGNAFDQSLLLANLLRTAGYTANIVQGTIRLTEAQFTAWFGTTDIWAARNYCFNLFIPVVTEPTWDGTTFYMDIKHVWVNWVDGANTWVFDPSVKAYDRKTGMSSAALASAMSFNSSTFMTDALSGATVDAGGDWVQNVNRSNIRSNLATFTSNLVSHIKNNAIGSAPAGTANVDDVLGGKSIVPATIPLLQTSLSYQMPGDTPTVWTGDVPSSFKPTIQVQFPNWTTPGVWDFTWSTTSEQLVGKRLTLWYDVSRVPSLYLDGSVVATGLAQPAGTWTSIFLTVTHPAYDASNYPLASQQFYQTNWQWWQSLIYTDGYYLIGNAWGNLGNGQTDWHQKKAKANEAAGGTSTSEAVLGEKLAHAFFSLVAQASQVCGLVNRIKSCQTVYSHQVGVVAFNSGGSNAYTCDIGGVSGSSTNLANDMTQVPINDTVISMHGVALEAAVAAQETGLTPGVSTTSVIDAANTAGNKLYKGTTANWNTGTNIRNTLVANGFNATDMDDLYNWYIQYGNDLVIHDQPTQTLGSWQGWGYWIFPTAGAFGIINGGLKGGGAQPGEIKIDEWGRRLGKDGQPISWDPIGMFSGDFYFGKEDISIGSGEYPYKLPFTSSYSSSRQFNDGSLGRGWKHNYQISAAVSSDGLLAMGKESAIQAATTIAELYVTAELVSDTTRPVTKLVTMTLADNWWIDQIVNNAVVVDFQDSAHTFIKLPDGSYASPFSSPCTLTLSGGLYTLKTLQQQAFNFDSSGNLATIVFPYGVTITLGYTAGKLTTISNGMSRTLTLAYTGAYLSSVTDGTGRSVAYSVNGTTKNLDSSTDPDSKTTTFVYDNPGRMTQIKKPANPTIAVVDNLYDSLDRVKEQTDALSNLWKYFLAGSRAEEQDPLGNRKIQYLNRFGAVLREINQLGKEWKFEYDGLNRQTKQTLPEGNSVTQTYDLKGNVLTRTAIPKSGSGLSNISSSSTYHGTFNVPLTMTDGRGNTTTLTYDAVTGKLLTAQGPQVGSPLQTPTRTLTWNARGQMLTVTDETGIVTQYNYDVSTEKLTSIVNDFGIGRLNLTVSFGYNSQGDINSVTDQRSNTSSFVFDSKRRLTQATSAAPFSYVSKYYFDANDNVYRTERQTGNPAEPWQVYQTAFNYADLPTLHTDPFGKITTRQYDALRRLWKTTDAENRVTESSYDAASRLSSVKDPSLTILETRLYTDNGLLLSQKDARNNVTTYSFDGHDRPDRQTFADASYTQNQTYDANGNVLTFRTRSGNTIVRTYDALNRVMTEAPQGQPTLTFTYDLASRLTKVNKPVVAGDPSTGDHQRFYDTAGRFFKEQYPDGKIVQHVLDGVGNFTKTTWPDSYFIDRIFDQLNRLTDIKLNGSGTSAVQFVYNALSQRTQMTYANGATISYQPQLNGDLTGIAHIFVGSAITFSYGYSNAHELVYSGSSDTASVWHPSGSSSVTYATADSVNKYPAVGGTSYSYDGNSNLTADGTWTYGFNTQNQLLSANKSGVSASFVYDPLNRQSQKTVGTAKSRYIYSGWQRIADYDGVTDSLQTRYVYGVGLDEPLVAIAAGGTLTYLHHDRLGSITATSDSSGVLANKNKFGPFGEVSTLTGTFGFTGQRYDSELGLYYYKHRVYSPVLGRFLQPDPVGYADGMNLYSYVNNAPQNMTDSLGLWGDFGPWANGPGVNGGWGHSYGPGAGFGAGMGPLGPRHGDYYYDPKTGTSRLDLKWKDPAKDPNYKGWKPGDFIDPKNYDKQMGDYIDHFMKNYTPDRGQGNPFYDKNGAINQEFNERFGNALRHQLGVGNLILNSYGFINGPMAKTLMLFHEWGPGLFGDAENKYDTLVDLANNYTGANLAQGAGSFSGFAAAATQSALQGALSGSGVAGF